MSWHPACVLFGIDSRSIDTNLVMTIASADREITMQNTEIAALTPSERESVLPGVSDAPRRLDLDRVSSHER